MCTRGVGDWGTVHPTPHAPSTYDSTQLLDSLHCDEPQGPPTIERPFQIYLTYRTTRRKRRRSNDTQVPLQTAEKPPVLTNHPRNTHTQPPSERQPLSTFSPHSHSPSPTSIAPPSPAPFRPRWGPRFGVRGTVMTMARSSLARG